MQQTLVLIKPNAMNLHIWPDILSIYSAQPNLMIIDMKIMQMDAELAEKFYQDHNGKIFFPELIRHMTSGPVIALIITGKNAIEDVRQLNGATNPAKADKNSIRGKYGTPDGGPKNAVHSSDSLKSAEREIGLIF